MEDENLKNLNKISTNDTEIDNATKSQLADEVRKMVKEVIGDDNDAVVRSILNDVFSTISRDKTLLQRLKILEVLNDQRNKLFANFNQETKKNNKTLNQNNNYPESNITTHLIVSDLNNIKKFPKNKIPYEEIYFTFLSILDLKDKDLRKKLFIEASLIIDDFGIGLEDLNNHIQSKYPNSRIISHISIDKELSDFEKTILKTSNTKKYHRPFSKNDLFVAILDNNPTAIREIVASNQNLLFEKDVNKTTPLNYFAFLENYMDYKDILIPAAGKNEAEIKDFIKLSRSRVITGLSYSTQSFSGLFGFGYENLMSTMLKDSKDFAHKDTIAKSLELIKDKNTHILTNNERFSKIKVVEAPYPTHAAYFVIKYDKQGAPAQISYCDGNLIHDQKHGEIVFDIDQNKLQKINKNHGSIETFLNREFRDVYKDKTNSEEIRSKFNNTVSELVVSDNSKPIIVERKIPSKAQNRGNCAYKSMNLATRAVMGEIDTSLKFDNGHGEPGGSGFQAFKQYKKSITNSCINNLISTASKEGFKTNISHDQVIEDLKPAFLHSIKKGHTDVAKKILGIFEKENIDLKEVRAENVGNKNLYEIFEALQKKQDYSKSSPKEDKIMSTIKSLEIPDLPPSNKTTPRENTKQTPLISSPSVRVY